jgi:hypothetical protein
MKVSQAVVEEVVRMLGLNEDQLFDQYYRVTNGDLTTEAGFQNVLGEPTIAPDWDPSPYLNCGHGLHLVWGHPFLALVFCSRIDPRFFRLPDGTTSEVVPSCNPNGKFRAQSITLLAENQLGSDAPEFDQKLLEQIALHADESSARQAAVNMITDQELLTKIAFRDWDSYVRQTAINRITDQEFLKKIALESSSYSSRTTAVGRITDQEFLKKIALESDSHEARMIAVGRITDQELLKKIASGDSLYFVREAAKDQLASLSS